MSDAAPSVRVELRLPAGTDGIRYARLVASAVGDDAGFDVDAIDDLKIAVDEVCVAVLDVDEDGAGPLDLVFRADEGLVEIHGSGPVPAGFAAPELDGNDLQAQILRAVVDEVSFTVTDGRAEFVVRRRG